jgi:hypothetical protein
VRRRWLLSSGIWIIFGLPKPISMRLTVPRLANVLLVCFVISSSSCHLAQHPAGAANPAVDTTPVHRAYDRTALVRALKELRGRILSGNKLQTGDIFSFPVSSMQFSTRIHEQTFADQEAQHGDSITRDMFNAYFETIDANVDLAGFRKLFSYLDPDSLLGKDEIEYDEIISAECYRGYRIAINWNNTEVSISYGLGTRNDYVSPTKAGDTAGGKTDTSDNYDPLDNPDPCWSPNDGMWEFVFDGKRLWFRDLSFSG